MFCQMTSGKPMRIKTSTGEGKVNVVTLMIDITKNSADVIEQVEYSEYWRGTEIEGEVKNVKFNLSDTGAYEYLRRTALANPHARIALIDPEGRKTVFERSVDVIPKPPESQKAAPKGSGSRRPCEHVQDNKSKQGKLLLNNRVLPDMSSAKVKEIQEFIGKKKGDKRIKEKPIIYTNPKPR